MNSGLSRSIGTGSPVALLGIGILLAGALRTFQLEITADVAWLLYVAARVLDGAELYVDVIEVNPPLIVFLSLVPEAFARVAGISELVATRILVLLLIVASLLMVERLLRLQNLRLPARTRYWVLGLLAFLLVPWVGTDFGQREHLLMVLVIPYLYSVAVTAHASRRPGRRIQIVTGVLAGVAIGLKPHFLPLWIGAECYLILKNDYRIAARPENLALMTILGVYGASILLLTPEYFRVARWALEVYGEYQTIPLSTLLQHPVLLGSAFVVSLHVLLRPSGVWREAGDVFSIAAAALASAVLLQGKGFGYHWYPVSTAALVVLSSDLSALMERYRWLPQKVPPAARLYPFAFCGILLAVTGAMYLTTPAKHSVNGGGDFVEKLMPVVEEYGGDGPLYSLTHDLGVAFPLVNYTGLGWGSRFNALSFLRGLKAKYGDTGKLPQTSEMPGAELERYIIDAVVADITNNKPSLIIVDSIAPVASMQDIGYVGYFSRDPRFREALSDYEVLLRSGRFLILQRRF